MFTGIINQLGTVKKRTATTLTIAVKLPKPKLGASIAVNGVCLTVTKTSDGVHSFDVGPDTWKRTNLGALAVGRSVNIEPSLRLGDEIGGHFVSGHVDAAADVISLEPWGEGFWRLRVELPQILRGLVAVKGSIAIDGISLTVAAVDDSSLSVALIPETIERTSLGAAAPGSPVNLEVDVLAKYVEKLVGASR
jgi:riboflavin synthase